MKSKTKKILTIVCALVLSVFMFAGCNLIEVNRGKYYGQKVIDVELKEGFSGTQYEGYKKRYVKKDLLNAYYNYAYEYVSQGQYTAEQGLELAINNMINVDLLYNYVKVNYFNNPEVDLTFTDEDENDAILEAYDSMQESIYTLENEIFEEWEIDILQDEDLAEDTDEPLRDEYKAYEPTLELVQIGGEYKAVLKEETKKHDNRVATAHFVPEIRNEEVSKEAYRRYIKQLQDAAKEEGASIDETTVLHNEEKRLKDIFIRSKYMSLFEDWYNKNYYFNYDATNNAWVLKDFMLEKVVNKYVEDFEIQKDNYEFGETDYHTAMAGDDISGIYYHHNSGNEYIQVSHILMNFSDKQKAEIKELDRKLAKNVISQERYDELKQDIANRTIVTYELNGKTYTSTAEKITEKIQNYVNRGDLEDKAKLFNEMIYVYNDDPGIMNKDYSYVVNIDTEVTDKMVAPFANKAREMHKDGKVGDVSDMVITEYGVHIIFYAGVVENIAEDSKDITFVDLMQKKTQASSSKSIFDVIYDSLKTETYQQDISNYVANCYEYITIKNYKQNYKDLLK